MPAQNMNVTVSTFETEFDMKLKPNALGKNLYDTIVATTGIREVRGKSFLFQMTVANRFTSVSKNVVG